MASAVLANQSDSNWPRQSMNGVTNKFIGNGTFSATKGNPNPKSVKKRQLHQQHFGADDHAARLFDDSSVVMQSAASDDASSINRKLNDFCAGAYVRFNFSSFSRMELNDLKRQLISELEQIREMRNRIESNDLPARSSSNIKSVSKKVSGSKRPLPPNFRKELKQRQSHHENGNGSEMKMCGQILSKLMKHKHGYIFNTPVDVVGLGLHDYYNIIKDPMDLGTVKSRMAKNFYKSPTDFAADVRLTFTNAMSYNPKGHEVYILAEQQLAKFDELFRPLNEKQPWGRPELQDQPSFFEVDLQASSWDRDRVKGDRLKKIGERDEEMDEERGDSVNIMDRSDKMGGVSGSGMNRNAPKQSLQAPVPGPASSPVKNPPVKSSKQPKPKAKDPNKRDMSLEEKHKLGLGLQSLPQEKMDNVVQIIRKRNGHLRQDGDEIELDIEAVDTETLWELDRFVTNYKKVISKMKRQALMGNNAVPSETDRGASVERIEVPTEPKKPKKGDAGEEDVDIGDELPTSSFPPIEIEKDNNRASSSSGSSSSSSSGSSSSRGSDSGSSSGSDSEAADDARS